MSQSKGFANGKHDLRRGIDFIGVTCAFICHDGNGKILLAKRSQNCRDEQGRWDNGGGAHEFGRTLEETVRREIKEEYGCIVKELKFIKAFDAHRKLGDGTPTHWVGLLYGALINPKHAKNNEPFKIDELGWYTFDNLPSPKHSQLLMGLKAAREAGII